MPSFPSSPAMVKRKRVCACTKLMVAFTRDEIPAASMVPSTLVLCRAIPFQRRYLCPFVSFLHHLVFSALSRSFIVLTCLSCLLLTFGIQRQIIVVKHNNYIESVVSKSSRSFVKSNKLRDFAGCLCAPKCDPSD